MVADHQGVEDQGGLNPKFLLVHRSLSTCREGAVIIEPE
jgi:hypothetical protein